MKIKDKVNEVIESGIAPIHLEYDRIDFFSDIEAERAAAIANGVDTDESSVDQHGGIIRSFMVINSLDLGTLTYKQYRFVARRTKQGDHMVKRHIEKLFREYPELELRMPKAECFTIPVYARLLKDGTLASMLFDGFTLFPDVPAEKICIELSADILYEDIEESKKRIDELRELGVKIAICEVGDEFCPVFRLAEIKFDYAFADEFATSTLDSEDAERVAGSLVKFLHFLNVKVVAPDLDSEAKIKGAIETGFDGFGFSEPLTQIQTEEVAE